VYDGRGVFTGLLYGGWPADDVVAKSMRFGIVLPHFRPVAGASAIRDTAQAVERLGFDSVWVTDRAALPPGSPRRQFGPAFFDPFVTLSYVAAKTERVRLGATVFVLPFRHPVLAARAIASLDQLSDGRVIVGAGAGWMPEEFGAIGVPFHRRGRLTDEYLEAMIALWSSRVASFSGPTVKFENLSSEPLPVQRPHPPIWVGGRALAALRRAVKHGDAWHGSPEPLSKLRQVTAALAEEAKLQGRDPASIKLTTRAPLHFATGSRTNLSGAELPDYPFGTPDEVIASIDRYKVAGFSELVFDTFFAGFPELDDATPESILRTMELFARAVMPAFKT
jgi:probable F420-dependent oxidoreductase